MARAVVMLLALAATFALYSWVRPSLSPLGLTQDGEGFVLFVVMLGLTMLGYFILEYFFGVYLWGRPTYRRFGRHRSDRGGRSDWQYPRKIRDPGPRQSRRSQSPTRQSPIRPLFPGRNDPPETL